MDGIPTIFELLQQVEFLRGLPAAYAVFLAALLVFILPDWRLALLALAGQYLFAGLLFVDSLDPRLAMIKVLVGLFVCLMLYITARQVNWGRLPEDVDPDEAGPVFARRQVKIGRYVLPMALSLRLLLAVLVIFLVAGTAQQQVSWLPAAPDHFPVALYALLAFGFIGFGLTSEPLKAGLGLLTFLLGFELYYHVLEQSTAMLTVLAVVDLTLALVIAYLCQARYAFTALLD